MLVSSHSSCSCSHSSSSACNGPNCCNNVVVLRCTSVLCFVDSFFTESPTASIRGTCDPCDFLCFCDWNSSILTVCMEL